MAKPTRYVRIDEAGVGRVFESKGLQDLQRAVARDGDAPGYIEGVKPQRGSLLPSNLQAYAHGEGVLLGYRPNPVATKLLNWPYPIHGPVVIRATPKTYPIIARHVNLLVVTLNV
jgi:hypothetical protein